MSNPFDMLGGMGGLGGMLASLQQNLKQAQEQAKTAEFTGQAGGGLVKAVCSGEMQVVSLTISEEAYEDREFLEDLVTAAINDGMRQAQESTQQAMSALTAGLPIPPGLLGM